MTRRVLRYKYSRAHYHSLLAYPLYAALSIMSWIADASVISVTTLSQLISGSAAAADVDKSDRVAVNKKPPMPLVVIIAG